MQEITAYDSAGEILSNLVQWDKDVFVIIQEDEIDSAYPVHFFNYGSNRAYVVNSVYSDNTLIAKIPNTLLTTAEMIIGYVYKEQETEQKSIYRFKISMRAKPMPSNYVEEGTKDYINIEDVLAECRELAELGENYSNLSKSWAVGDTGIREGENNNNSKYWSEQSKKQTDIAAQKATAAASSAAAAKVSENNSKISETNAKTSETNAMTSAANAANSEAAAKISENNAADSAAESQDSASLSKSWAVGGTGTRDGEDTDNSKYYSQQSKLQADISTAKADEASESAINAESSANTAAEKADSAKKFSDNASAGAVLAESWAIGGTDTRDGEDTDNSRYYAEKSGEYTQYVQDKADEAAQSAAEAKDSANNADESAAKAEQSEQNAKMYAEQAEAMLFGDNVMIGATEETDGVKGFVPKPCAGDQEKFLKGDGTWQDISLIHVIASRTRKANKTDYGLDS
ncbi:MAG: hypothetical protein HDT46_11425 [Ruminococcaceae bacterium]|nr:hypothetical protein [Oscillospiraceae bacterium]